MNGKLNRRVKQPGSHLLRLLPYSKNLRMKQPWGYCPKSSNYSLGQVLIFSTDAIILGTKPLPIFN
ncbi:MAG: hypothetical protein RLZZ338_3776 [Cyanobacteriota bacterium]|jgi:hypothetical protein